MTRLWKSQQMPEIGKKCFKPLILATHLYFFFYGWFTTNICEGQHHLYDGVCPVWHTQPRSIIQSHVKQGRADHMRVHRCSLLTTQAFGLTWHPEKCGAVLEMHKLKHYGLSREKHEWPYSCLSKSTWKKCWGLTVVHMGVHTGYHHWSCWGKGRKAAALKWHHKCTMQAPFAKLLMTHRDAAEWFTEEYDLNSS